MPDFDVVTTKKVSIPLAAAAVDGLMAAVDKAKLDALPPGGAPGPAGASAYEVAVANGFVGTEPEWLASLVGAPGEDGAPGANGTDGQDGQDGADGQDLRPAVLFTNAEPTTGFSEGDAWVTRGPGYLVRVRQGGAWVDDGTLRGPPGVDGANGTNGTNGNDGADGQDGADGSGVPAGGATGQVLAKASNADGDVIWATPGVGSGSSPVLYIEQFMTPNSGNDGIVHPQLGELVDALNNIRNTGTRLECGGGGQINTNRTLFFQNVWRHLPNLRIQAGQQGDFGNTKFMPTLGMPNIDTVSVDGQTKGVIARASANASNRERFEGSLNVQGDGIFNDKNSSTCVGVWFADDDTSLGEHTVSAAYCYAGAVIQGQEEKHRIKLRTLYCNWGVWAIGSCDTMLIELNDTNSWHLYGETDGFDGSIELNLLTENRQDPGDGSPAIWIRNGKNTTLSGKCRSINGPLFILVDKSSSGGVDSVTFKGLEVIHSHGMIELRRVRRASGAIYMKDFDPAGPSFKIGAVEHGGLYLSMGQILSPVGLQIGDATNFPNGLGIRASIQMGNPTPQGGSLPTTTALDVVKATLCTVSLDDIAGKIQVSADMVNSDIRLPRSFVTYAPVLGTPGAGCNITGF